MFGRRLLPASRHRQSHPVAYLQWSVHSRAFSASATRAKNRPPSKRTTPAAAAGEEGEDKSAVSRRRRSGLRDVGTLKIRRVQSTPATDEQTEAHGPAATAIFEQENAAPQSLKEALLGAKKIKLGEKDTIPIEILAAKELDFEPVEHEIPPIPRLSHGLDRVLFNPGVYRLQDPRSRVYNFDPYLEKIMPPSEFDFDALSEYKTSSKDEDLLAMTKRLGTKFTGSTSSMSGVLQHFHFLLSGWRSLDHSRLSRAFPPSSSSFSKITTGPSAILLRKKGDQYAIDADKAYDTPNIMSWLGHSLEKLLTNSREEFERFRRSNTEAAPSEDDSGRCFHYSRLGNFLMRSQLDAHDSRLPGSGVFDLKTRAVVSIRMDHTQYETGSGYQIRYDQGEWESYEREFFDMTRATMLKYSLQVRMGRMDGIFVAYHNIERLFGFQYLGLPELDQVLHGQTDPCLGDQEFRLSIRLLDEILQRATKAYPDTSIRLHVETRGEKGKIPFLYAVACPVTEEEADSIQNAKTEVYKEFERDVIGLNRDDPETQAEWQDIQERVEEEMEHEELVDESKSVEAEELIEESESTGEQVVEESQSAQNEESVEKSKSAEDQEFVEESKRVEDEEHIQQSRSAEGSTEQVNEQILPTESVEDVTANNDDVTTDSSAGAVKITRSKKMKLPPHKGPVTGWTVAIRNCVNGVYVDRPQDLQPSDNWKLEYHIKEIPKDGVGKVYDSIRQRRHDLIGQDRDEQNASLARYRDIIRNYSEKGRKWREEQDQIDAEVGQRIFRPLGPGSEEAPAEVQRE